MVGRFHPPVQMVDFGAVAGCCRSFALCRTTDDPPVRALEQIGFTIAFGVLLDTVLVRSFLVPALTVLLDHLAWWPGPFARGGTTGDPDRGNAIGGRRALASSPTAGS